MNKPALPTHEILGANGKPNKSLTEMVRAQVCKELRMWHMALHNSSALIVTKELDARVKELYDSCSEDVREDINAETEKAIKDKATTPVKTSLPTTGLSKIDNLIFDMNIEGATIIAIQDDTHGPKKTCGYFPWEYQGTDTQGRFPGGFMHVNDILALMIDVAGGFSRKDIADAPTTNRYKGWSTCRLCGCKNGSSESEVKGHAVPEGLLHVLEKHKLPANLFSLVCGSKRVFYIAKKPFKQTRKG